MIFKLSPQRRDDQLVASVSGNLLTLNGEEFNLGFLNEGDVLPAGAIASDWIVGPVFKQGGEIHLTLVLPHGANAPEATRFPQPVAATAGRVPLPLYDAVPEPVPEPPRPRAVPLPTVNRSLLG